MFLVAFVGLLGSRKLAFNFLRNYCTTELATKGEPEWMEIRGPVFSIAQVI